MYADHITDSMRRAIDETTRRRQVQHRYNQEHGIEPVSIVKQIRDLTESVRQHTAAPAEVSPTEALASLPRLQLDAAIRDLEKQMKQAAKDLEFEKAAMLRDQIMELRQIMALREAEDEHTPLIDM
jgi:excinuclease ABC subunit B